MIHINDLVELKNDSSARKGQVVKLERADDITTCHVRWDGFCFSTEHKENDLRIIATMYERFL